MKYVIWVQKPDLCEIYIYFVVKFNQTCRPGWQVLWFSPWLST